MASFALTSPVSFQVVACDLLDKFDDASPQLWLLYPHERLSERERVGTHVVRMRSITNLG